MGVKGIFPFVAKRAPELVRHPKRFQGLRGKRIAIDATLALTTLSFSAVSLRSKHLLGIFRLISSLHAVQATPILVFDGPSRLPQKARENARRRSNRLKWRVRGGWEEERTRRLGDLAEIVGTREMSSSKTNAVGGPGVIVPGRWDNLITKHREETADRMREVERRLGFSVAQQVQEREGPSSPPDTSLRPIVPDPVPLPSTSTSSPEPSNAVPVEEDFEDLVASLASDMADYDVRNDEITLDARDWADAVAAEADQFEGSMERSLFEEGEHMALDSLAHGEEMQREAELLFADALSDAWPGPPAEDDQLPRYIAWLFERFLLSTRAAALAPVHDASVPTAPAANADTSDPSSLSRSSITPSAPSAPSPPLGAEDSPTMAHIKETARQADLTAGEASIFSILSSPDAAAMSLSSSDVPLKLSTLLERASDLNASYVRMGTALPFPAYTEAAALGSAMGCPILWLPEESPHEAEAMCARLVMEGYADLVASEDSDTLLYDVPLLRHLTSGLLVPSDAEPPRLRPSFDMVHEDTRTPGQTWERTWESRPSRQLELLDGEQVRRALGFEDRKQWVDFGLLCGTDFARGIKGVAIGRGFKLIQEHGSIPAILNVTPHSPPDGVSLEEYLDEIESAREVFANPPPLPRLIVSSEDPDLLVSSERRSRDEPKLFTIGAANIRLARAIMERAGLAEWIEGWQGQEQPVTVAALEPRARTTSVDQSSRHPSLDGNYFGKEAVGFSENFKS